MNITQPEVLKAYLVDGGYISSTTHLELNLLTGGVSNKTVLVRFSDGESWVIKQALEKLLVEQDWFCDPARLKVEYLAMKWLNGILPEGYVPKPVFFDEKENLMGMEAVRQPHFNLKSKLMEGEVKLAHFETLGYVLGTVHQKSQTDEKAKTWFSDRTFYEILRIEPYYRFSAARSSDFQPFFEALIQDTYATTKTIVHGDFSPKNILIYKDQLVLLDHEVMHFGDPAFDVGFMLTHLISKAHHFERYRQQFLKAALLFWHTYTSHFSDISESDENRMVRHTIGCMIARVLGRSPLEYLTKNEKENQLEMARGLIQKGLANMEDFFSALKQML